MNSRSLTSFGMTLLLLAVAVCCSAPLRAQDAVAPGSSLGHYEFTAGYASVTGATDNGTLLSFSKQFSPRVALFAKDFMLASPAHVNIATVGPRYRFPLSAIRKADGYFDSSKWLPFVDMNAGVVKDATGVTKFAYGPGVGLDYKANDSLTLLIVEADYLRSKFFPQGGILVSNVHSFTSGLRISF